MSIEQNIKNLILNHDYTLKSFAESIDIPYTTLITMLNGDINKSSINNVIKVAKGLNMTVDELISSNNSFNSIIQLLDATKTYLDNEIKFDIVVREISVSDMSEHVNENPDDITVYEDEYGGIQVAKLGCFYKHMTLEISFCIIMRNWKSEIKIKDFKLDIETEFIYDQVNENLIKSSGLLLMPSHDLDFFNLKDNVYKQRLEKILCNTIATYIVKYDKDFTDNFTLKVVYKNINQLKEPVEGYISEIKEPTKKFHTVYVTEKVAAGNGYSYGNNESEPYYTDRDDLKDFDFATLITGDSMEPTYHDGDIILVKSGYDNVNGDVYVIDYDGQSYVKKLYNDGDRFRLVSINRNYENIIIDVPPEDGVYFNIVGKVVDSFKPIEKF